MRVVSLLPSTTEIVFALGGEADLVGVSFECDHPPPARTLPRVTGTSLPAGLAPGDIDEQVRALLAAGTDLYTIDRDALQALDPDLLLTQDLCSVCALSGGTVEQSLGHLGSDADVLTVSPSTLEQVLESIVRIGAAVQRQPAAQALVQQLRARLQHVASTVAGRPRPRVAVLEWTDPPFSAGHWVPELVTAAGGLEVLGEPGGRSVPTSWQALGAAAPGVVVVAACGFGLAQTTRMAAELVQAGCLPSSAAVLAIDADGCVVRPGPRLLDGVEALAAALHPGVLASRPEICTTVRAASQP